MIYYLEYLEDETSHGKLDGLCDEISSWQEDRTVLASSVGNPDG